MTQTTFYLSDTEIVGDKKEKPVKVLKPKKVKAPPVFDCAQCGLLTQCTTPNMKMRGLGELGIMIVLGSPNRSDDLHGTSLYGDNEDILSKVLGYSDVSLLRDCVITHVCRCCAYDKNGDSRAPKTLEIKCCRSKLLKEIKEIQPSLIICLGEDAVEAVLDTGIEKAGFNQFRGFVFPYQPFDCWVGGTYHPDDIKVIDKYRKVFVKDIKKMIGYLGKPMVKPYTSEGNTLITDSSAAVELLEWLSDQPNPVAFDYETTCLSAFDANAKILTVSFSVDETEGWCIWLDNLAWTEVEKSFVWGNLARFIASPVLKVVQNYYMEELWSRTHVGQSIAKLKMDTMVTSHVVNCRAKTTSLEFQVFHETGHEYKHMVDSTNMINEPIEKISDYTCWDSRYTLKRFKRYDEFLNLPQNKSLLDFNDWLTGCLPCLANLSERGICVDTQQLKQFDEETDKIVLESEELLQKSVAGKKYFETYQCNVDIESPKKLSELVYDIYKTKPSKRKTGGGKASVDAEELARIVEETKSKSLKDALDLILKYKKSLSFSKKIKEYKECVDKTSRLHPTFNMNIAGTYRSSASNPNVQNMFKHDKELKKFRKIIVPSAGRVFLEVDESGLEMRVAACVSKDEVLGNQIKNKVDSHRKWAAHLYEKNPQDITKDERFEAKNSFVFASIYGSLPKAIARNMKLPFGLVADVQRLFWQEYEGVREWQKKTLEFYQKYGYIQCVTGFRRYAPLDDEQLYNTPIQGPAFHLVLNCLKKIDQQLQISGMGEFSELQTRPVVEIHDSILFDAVPEEVEEVVAIVDCIMKTKQYAWQLDIPFDVEWEIGKNFYDMEPLKVIDGVVWENVI